jgi:hypothetical protein
MNISMSSIIVNLCFIVLINSSSTGLELSQENINNSSLLYTLVNSETSYVDSALLSPEILAEASAQRADEGTFHLFSHGQPGQLLLDGEWKNAQQIAAWLNSTKYLQNKSHLNIYGCNFAEGETGKIAVAYLEKELAISIAASDDVTGIDGDWVLEVGSHSKKLDLRYYPGNLQTCDIIDPNALVNTYPQVFTCGADDVTDAVIGMSDATGLSYNTNTQIPNKFSDAGWTLSNVGNIYYLEFDNAGCLYAPASRFTQSPDDDGLQQFGSLGGSDAIYKMDAVTGAPTVWTNIPTAGKGFGGITYDYLTNTMYVVNLGDNSIYHLDINGNTLDVFQPDPVVLGVVNGTTNSNGFNGSGAPIVNFQNHPFGLDINPVDGRLYYTVIDATGSGSLVVRSVGRTLCGEMMDATDEEEINFVMENTFFSGISSSVSADPVSGDIDFNEAGDMAVGTWSTGPDFRPTYSNYYASGANNAANGTSYGQANSMFNHTAANYTFTESGGTWSQTAITTVGQEDFCPSIGCLSLPNGTSTGGVAWDITNPDVLWMSGGDFLGENSQWGVIGYDVNQLDNTYDQEDASNYVQFLFEPQVNSDPKGNGGDVDVFSCPPCVSPTAPEVTVMDNVCPSQEGTFTVSSPCGPGSHLEWSTDGGITFSTSTPVYDNNSIQNIKVVCVDDAEGCISPSVSFMTNPEMDCCGEPDCTEVGLTRN